MVEKELSMPLCDVHNDKVAQTFCKYHKKLLCLSCALEKAKSQECSIHEITKISGELDTTIYEWLLVRQMAIKKRRSIEAHEQKTETLKSTLKKEVTELHEKLVKRLHEMKESCLQSIDVQAETALAQDKLSKIQLDIIDKIITENIEKLSAQSIDDLRSSQANLNDVKTKVKKEVPDIAGDPEGDFKPNKPLETLILKTGNSLGVAVLICPDYYEVIDNIDFDAKNEKERSDVVLSEELKYSIQTENPENLASDEVIFDRKKKEKSEKNKPASIDMAKEKTPRAEQMSKIKEYKTDINQQEEDSKSTRMSKNVTAEKRKEGPFAGLFRRKKSDQTE